MAAARQRRCWPRGRWFTTAVVPRARHAYEGPVVARPVRGAAPAVRHFIFRAGKIENLAADAIINATISQASASCTKPRGELALDGRRLGFVHRDILALRAVELAKAQLAHRQRTALSNLAVTAKEALLAGISVGLNDALVKREDAHHKIEVCSSLLDQHFADGSAMGLAARAYEPFTASNLVRETEILLTGDVSEMARRKA